MGIPPAAGGEGAITGADRDTLLDLLFDHRADVIREFLRERECPVSGTKAELRDRISGFVDDGTIPATDLVDLLDEVEGWGNQHIYLYRAPAEADALKEWATADSAVAILRRHKLDHLFNRRRRLVLPPSREMVTVEWSERQVRFVWVEGRVWRERRPDLDRREEPEAVDRFDAPAGVPRSLLFDAYEEFHGRGIIAFEFDLVSGLAGLFIQRLEAGNNYSAVREQLIEELQPLVNARQFTPIRVGRSIVHLESEPGVRRRQIEHTTERGSRINYVSSERGQDAFSDPTLEQARRGAGARVVGRLGNFYWRLPDEEREIHVKLYAADQRVGLFGEYSEQEVRYVLRRIRKYCR